MIYFQPGVHGRPLLIFSYARTGVSPESQREDVPPTVTWLDAGHLRIEIDVVSEIYEQHNIVDGVQVQYQIGHVEYPRVHGQRGV
jgi:hypothetical protein